MALRIVEFIAVVATALALVPVGSHLAALPNKIGMPAEDYLAAQQIYAGWAWFGVVDVAAIIAAAVLASILRGTGGRFWLAATACALLVVSMIVFFIFVFPQNGATGNWTSLPEDWQGLRTSWEFGHATEGVLTFAGFCAMVLAVIMPGPAAS